jgi:hypothetical protein
VLKKKALTAVLTAAFVLGIGGMATESIISYEHGQSDTCIHGLFEPALAHAASIRVTNNSSSTQSAPLPTSSWRCYFCGSFTNHGSQYIQDSNGVWRSREPNPNNSGKCSHKHVPANGTHLWVWVSGAPPVADYSTYRYCRRCDTLSGRFKKGQWESSWNNGCRANNGGPHAWEETGIVRTR